MNSFFDGIMAVILFPAAYLRQRLWRFMDNLFIWSVSTTILLVAAFVWVKVFPAPKPLAPPMQIVQPAPVQPAAAPCQPYYIHC